MRDSAPTTLVFERRQDPRRERWRAAALDKLDQRVQIHAALVRQLLAQRRAEAGLAQPCTTPRNRVRGFTALSRLAFASRLSALSGLSAGPQVHAYLAPLREPFLLGESNYRAQGGRGGEIASAGALASELSQAAAASSCVV